jgi:polysaccharide pyruvyl transferase WcaK-like protein
MKVVVVDPGMASSNLGDQIISDAITREFVTPVSNGGADVSVMPMHGILTDDYKQLLREADEVVVCGTNLLSDNMRFRSSWEWNKADIALAKGKLTVFGAGWWQYQVGGVDPLTARWMRNLSSGRAWGVRDEYSQQRLMTAGVKAQHLSCPTLWRVTSQKLPFKQPRVVVTLTDYNQDPLADRRLINLLAARFQEVLFWPQGPGDRKYIESLDPDAKFIAPSLQAFDDALKLPGSAYVGLRLHGGIRALQFGVPSLIMSIDNRAREISRSVGLFAPSRNDFRSIEAALSGRDAIELRLPHESISTWKKEWGIS